MRVHIARGTLELTAPFLVARGREGSTADLEFVADANGFPAIPGSSLAGVLRAAYRTACSREGDECLPAETALFGSEPGSRRGEGHGSALWTSWGHIHDSRGRPVEGLLHEPSSDEVLAFAHTGVRRDHVRISDRGAAERMGKRDELLVAAGHRFSFEIRLDEHSPDSLAPGFDRVLELLYSGDLTFGRGRGRGLGAFAIRALATKRFDLTTPDGVRRLAELGSSLVDIEGFEPVTLDASMGQDRTRIEIPLRSRALWFIGSPEPGADVDLHPFRETRVTWEGSRGQIVDEPVAVLPGSSLRGALRHRVAFHYNRIRGQFATRETRRSELSPWIVEENDAVKALFGSRAHRGGTGGRGRIRVRDVVLSETTRESTLHHVSLDRFTGGALEGHLFQEKGRWQEDVTVTIEVDRCRDLDADIRRSLALTVRDLETGALALGSGFGRGNGTFELAAGTRSTWDPAPWNCEEGD